MIPAQFLKHSARQTLRWERTTEATVESETESRKDKIAFYVVMMIGILIVAFMAGQYWAGVNYGCWVVG